MKPTKEEKRRKINPKSIDLKLYIGNSEAYHEDPIISFIPDGKNTYLWIGNNRDANGCCYATHAGKKRLLKFAKALVKELESK